MKITTKTTNNNDDEDDDENADVAITHSDVFLCIDRIKAYACKEGLNSLYDKISERANMVQDAVVSKYKQTNITDFFKPQEKN